MSTSHSWASLWAGALPFSKTCTLVTGGQYVFKITGWVWESSVGDGFFSQREIEKSVGCSGLVLILTGKLYSCNVYSCCTCLAYEKICPTEISLGLVHYPGRGPFTLSNCRGLYTVNQHLSLIDLRSFLCLLLKVLASREMTKKQGIKFDSS